VIDHSYDYQAARLRYPFLEYAIENWAYHASQYDIVDEEFFRSITKIVDSENPDFRRWVYLKWNTKMRGREPALDAPTPSALHIAAYAGLTEYAKNLLHKGYSVCSVDSEERTPLHLACKHNHAKMVSLILEHGANPDPEDCRGVKPIHEAARRNHATIVKMLLEAGVDPLSPKTHEDYEGYTLGGQTITTGETAVEYVCKQGHADTLFVLLPYLRSEALVEVSCESCRYGKFENVRTVLENSDVSPDLKFNGATALYLACLAPNVQCVELWLARGADVRLVSTRSPKFTGLNIGKSESKEETPLHALVLVWMDSRHIPCQATFRMLIGAGAAPEAKDGHNETPLFGKRRKGCPPQITVKSLLEAGADISAVDRHGETMLHRLLEHNKDLEYLQLLLDYGADINARGRNENTALHALFEHGFGTIGQKHPNNLDETIKFLLEKGADCNMKNDRGSTVLNLAMNMKDCSLQTFKLLLKYCSDENSLWHCLFQVHSRQDFEEKVEIIQELVSAGLSLEARDKEGKTALLHNYQNEDTIKSLLQCGARLDAVDSNCWCPLDYLALYSPGSHQAIEKLQGLVDLGLSPFKVDKKGKSILHHAVSGFVRLPGNIQFIKRILEYGVSVNVKDFNGRTPLHDYIESNYSLGREPESPLISLLSLFQQNGGDKLDINAQDAEGLTLLHIAAIRSEITLSRLLAAGADASILTNNGRSVLHLACRARKSNIIGHLLQETGSMLLDKADSFGRTPLHDACTSGRPESVYYLLKAGAVIKTKDHKGRTPLHSCAEFAIEQRIWFALEHSNDAAGQFTSDRFRPAAYRGHPDDQWYKPSRS
jgi:ankyrin repeat protein